MGNMEQEGPVRIAVVDDHAIIAEGIQKVLAEFAPTLEWVGTVPSLARLRVALGEWSPAPDVVLYDLHLNDGSTAPEGIEELVARGIKVVVLTGEWRPIPIRDAVKAGACGVMLKADPPERMAQVITTAASGNFAVSGEVAYLLVTDASLTPRLAPREIEALQLLAAGLPRKVIGKRMSPPVAETTVVTYFNRVVQKYRDMGRAVNSPQDAVRAAEADGYLEPPGPPSEPSRNDPTTPRPPSGPPRNHPTTPRPPSGPDPG